MERQLMFRRKWEKMEAAVTNGDHLKRLTQVV
jgi:hypothetical protein